MNIFNNLKWNTFSQIFKIATQLVGIIYLARIIAPSEYGIMAMAGVIINFASLFRDLGTSAAIIQKEILNDNIKSTVFWLNFILGLMVSLSICISSPLFSEVYQQPKLLIILPLLSISFIISGSSSLHLALLERESKFNVISKVEVFSSLISLIVAVLMANHNFGVYSLVAQSLLNALISGIFFWAFSPWYPKCKPKNIREGLKDIFRFTSQLSLFNMINFFSRNLDSFLIGKYMSASTLGAYNLAYRIMLFPLTSLTFIANRSLFPILSKKKNEYEEIEKIYLNTIYIIWFITLPLIAIITSLNDIFVLIVFGEKWSLTAQILLWLAPTAILQSVLSTTGTIFMSQGKTGTLLLLGIQGTILTAIAFISSLSIGIIELSKFYFIANLIHFTPCMYFTMKTIKSGIGKIVNKTYPLFIAAAISFVTIYFSKNYFEANIKSFISLGALGIFIYVAVLIPTNEIKTFIGKRKNKLGF